MQDCFYTHLALAVCVWPWMLGQVLSDTGLLPLPEFNIVFVSFGSVLLFFLFMLSIISVTVVHVVFVYHWSVSVSGCYIYFLLSKFRIVSMAVDTVFSFSLSEIFIRIFTLE